MGFVRSVVVPTWGANDLKTYALAAVIAVAPIALVIWFLVRVWRAIPKWMLAVVGVAAAVVLAGVVKK